MRAREALTFHEILECTRPQAAISAWTRARQASVLRHVAVTHGNKRAASVWSETKLEAIQRVAFLLPEQVTITIDSEYQVGLLSVSLEGHGRLHLPANTFFEGNMG